MVSIKRGMDKANGTGVLRRRLKKGRKEGQEEEKEGKEGKEETGRGLDRAPPLSRAVPSSPSFSLPSQLCINTPYKN